MSGATVKLDLRIFGGFEEDAHNACFSHIGSEAGRHGSVGGIFDEVILESGLEEGMFDDVLFVGPDRRRISGIPIEIEIGVGRFADVGILNLSFVH